MNLNNKEFSKLDSKKGLYALLQNDELNPAKALRTLEYEKRLAKLQEELIKMQNWVYNRQNQM